jgi:hypothetical protein
MAHWQPPGRALPIAGHMAHVALAEDLLMANFVTQAAPVFQSTHTETGISEMMPPQGPWEGWARTVHVDLPALRAYTQAVFANTEEYVNGLSAADLNREVDMSALGFGKHLLGGLLNTLALNCAAHTGEISAIKGLQDKQGYPF